MNQKLNKNFKRTSYPAGKGSKDTRSDLKKRREGHEKIDWTDRSKEKTT